MHEYQQKKYLYVQSSMRTDSAANHRSGQNVFHLLKDGRVVVASDRISGNTIQKDVTGMQSLWSCCAYSCLSIRRLASVMARGDVYSHQRKTISIVRNIIDGDAIDQLYLQVMDMMSGGVVGRK